MMNISISIHDFNSICRVCLQKTENTLILMTTDIMYMIESCTSVQENFNNSKMPQQMCIKCHAQLKNAYEFRQQYFESTKILTTMILKTETQLDESENEVETENDNFEYETLNKQFDMSIKEIKIEQTNDVSNVFTESILRRQLTSGNGTANEEELIKNEVEADNENFEYETGNDEFETFVKELTKAKTHVNVDVQQTELTSDIDKLLQEEQRKLALKIKIDDLTCGICGRKFKRRKYRQKHEKTHSDTRPYYKCSVCGKIFKSKHGLLMHVDEKHKDRRDICFICGKIILPSRFHTHVRIHHRTDIDKKYKCVSCEREYVYESSLQQHVQEKHTDTVRKQFNCDICNKEYTSEYTLKKHKRYMHLNERTFKCHCGKSFKTLAGMNTHIKVTHNDLRPHKCSTCNKAFHTKQILKNHMVCHTGERPWTCEVCGKSFGQRSALRTHKKLHSK